MPNIDTAPLPLDDFTTTVKRGNYITARCHDANKILNIRGTFVYSGTGEAPDTVDSTEALHRRLARVALTLVSVRR